MRNTYSTCFFICFNFNLFLFFSLIFSWIFSLKFIENFINLNGNISFFFNCYKFRSKWNKFPSKWNKIDVIIHLFTWLFTKMKQIALSKSFKRYSHHTHFYTHQYSCCFIFFSFFVLNCYSVSLNCAQISLNYDLKFSLRIVV